MSQKSLQDLMNDLNNMLGEQKSEKSNGSGGQHPPRKAGNSGGGDGSGGFDGGDDLLKWIGSSGWLILFILISWGVNSSFYQVEAEEQGVVTRFGKYLTTTAPGLNFKIPFGIDKVYKVSVTRQHSEEFGHRTQSQSRHDLQQARDEGLMLTGDLNIAQVEWHLLYIIHDPKKFLFHATDVRRNLRDTSISVMRRVVGDRYVSDILTTERATIAKEALELTQETLNIYDMGLTITQLFFVNVTPPEKVQPAFHEVNTAKQEKEETINKAESEYNRQVPAAQGAADKIVAEAEGYAINLTNTAKGDAQKFASVLKAYKLAPVITKKRMYLEAMEEIFSSNDKIRIVDTKVKGVLPVFGENIQKK
ncbi:MAG: FtsH protease activity modulator HflK [Oligoflexales bacterium]